MGHPIIHSVSGFLFSLLPVRCPGSRFPNGRLILGYPLPLYCKTAVLYINFKTELEESV